MQGAGLALLAIFLFLRRLRPTLVIALAIPTSSITPNITPSPRPSTRLHIPLSLCNGGAGLNPLRAGGGGSSAEQRAPLYPPPGAQSVLLSGSAFAYAFGGHGMFPEEIRELRDKTEWNRRVMPWTYGIIVPTYALCSYLGYYVWGGGDAGSSANINANFPANAANVLSIVVQLATNYYLIFYNPF